MYCKCTKCTVLKQHFKKKSNQKMKPTEMTNDTPFDKYCSMCRFSVVIQVRVICAKQLKCYSSSIVK